MHNTVVLICFWRKYSTTNFNNVKHNISIQVYKCIKIIKQRFTSVIFFYDKEVWKKWLLYRLHK